MDKQTFVTFSYYFYKCCFFFGLFQHIKEKMKINNGNQVFVAALETMAGCSGHRGLLSVKNENESLMTPCVSEQTHFAPVVFAL